MIKRYQKSIKALGSDIAITLVGQIDEVTSQNYFEELFFQIEHFENKFSRFLKDSELTSLNNAAGQKFASSNEMLRLVKLTMSMSSKTNGIFNPLVLPRLQQVGYSGSWTKDVTKAEPGTNFSKRLVKDPNDIEISKTWIRLPKDSALDFGGIGKGYLLDQLAEYLSKQALSGFVLSIGGDILCSGKDLDNKPWYVGVQASDGSIVRNVSNSGDKTLAIATSGITKRKGIKDGQAWHHIIDPRSLEPSNSSVQIATVTARTGVEADVYAKSIVIDGQKLAKKYLDEGKVKSYILQLKNSELLEGGQ